MSCSLIIDCKQSTVTQSQLRLRETSGLVVVLVIVS